MKKLSKTTFFTKRTKRHLAELTLILMSVLLAFILSELRNNYNENKRLEISLDFIQEEISSNHEIIKETIEIHKNVIQKIDSLIENGIYETAYTDKNGFAYQNIYKNNSYFNQILIHDAWTIANNNQILSKLKIKDIAIISRAYEQQEMVMNTAWEISDFLQSAVVYDKNMIEINCKMLKKKFQLITGFEIRLLRNYTVAEETLSKLID